jgi:hypothetical protein
VLRESPYINNSLDELAWQAQNVARQLPEDSQAAEFADLVRQAAQLR